MSGIVIDSAFNSIKNYYPQAFLEELKYKLNKKEIESFIEDDLENFSDIEYEEGRKFE